MIVCCIRLGQFFDSKDEDGRAQTTQSSSKPAETSFHQSVDGLLNVAYRAETQQSSTAKNGDSYRAVSEDADQHDGPSQGRWSCTKKQLEPSWDVHLGVSTELHNISFYFEFVSGSGKVSVKTKAWVLVADEPFVVS